MISQRSWFLGCPYTVVSNKVNKVNWVILLGGYTVYIDTLSPSTFLISIKLPECPQMVQPILHWGVEFPIYSQGSTNKYGMANLQVPCAQVAYWPPWLPSSQDQSAWWSKDWEPSAEWSRLGTHTKVLEWLWWFHVYLAHIFSNMYW